MLAQAVGVRTTLLLAALGMTLSTLFVIASPVRRLRTVT
jgi:hydrogenase-4 membrane subunit HyfE